MKKALKPALTALRIILPAVLLALAIWQLCYSTGMVMYAGSVSGFRYGFITPYIAVLCTVIMFYFAVKYAVLFDRDMREKYIENRDSIKTAKDKLKLFFGGKYKTALIVTLYAAVFPVWFWLHFCRLFLGWNTSLIFTPVALASFLLIAIRAFLSAVKFWEEKAFYYRHYGFKYTANKCASKHLLTFVAFFGGGLLLILFVNTAGSAFVSLIIENISSLFGLFTLFFHLFFIFPKVTKRIMSAVKRRKFLRELEEVCQKNDCSLSAVKNPYKSLFKNIAGEYNFELERGGVVYACKLMSVKHRLRPMTFFEDGVAAISKIVSIKQTELYRSNKYVRYGFEAEGKKKIIIINPIPKSLFVSDRTGDVPIDNGDKVWNYRAYSASAFINAIDRNCLGK